MGDVLVIPVPADVKAEYDRAKALAVDRDPWERRHLRAIMDVATARRTYWQAAASADYAVLEDAGAALLAAQREERKLRDVVQAIDRYTRNL